MLFELDILIPEVVLIFAINFLTVFPLVLGKYFKQAKYLPKQSQGTHTFSIVILIFLIFLILNNNTTSNLFGFHLYTNGLIWVSKLIILIFATITLIISSQHQKRFETVILILAGTLGALLVVGAGDLIIVYLGLELISLATYVLLATNNNKRSSVEAAIKYLLFSVLSSGFILLGIAIIYNTVGTTAVFNEAVLRNLMPQFNFYIANLFLVIGFAFKLGLFPFHNWVTDVYQGAPLHTVTYLILIPKTVYVYFMVFLSIQYQDLLLRPLTLDLYLQ